MKKSKGMAIDYVGATDNHWQLITSKYSRIRQLKQLDDKMVAMTRFSVTDMLSDRIADSVKIEKDKLFKVQVNDLHVRLMMLINHELDAVWMAEPHATQARTGGNKVLADSRKMDTTILSQTSRPTTYRAIPACPYLWMLPCGSTP